MIKTRYKTLPFLVALLLTLQVTYAYDFTINPISAPASTPYEGETAELSSSVTMADNACKLDCNWKTENYEGTIGTELIGGETKNFDFKVEAKGINGYVSTKLSVICKGKIDWNCWIASDKEHSSSVGFNFEYNGDGTCTTRNAYESCVNAKNDCSCGQYKSCIDNRGDQNRDVDERKCATYCGNKQIERQHETCSNCPTDVGKCGGEFCTNANECEGAYCVHQACSSIPYRISDGFCDSSVSENCRNSAKDCACRSNERCGSQGVCETYCGNRICETDEQGICADDCDWCGDGVCQEGKETCRGCAQDCGECKLTEAEETTQKELSQIKEEAQSVAQQTRKVRSITNITFYSIAGLIIIIIVMWLIFKIINDKKSKEKEKKERSNIKICKKCKSENPENAKFCRDCGKKLK